MAALISLREAFHCTGLFTGPFVELDYHFGQDSCSEASVARDLFGYVRGTLPGTMTMCGRFPTSIEAFSLREMCEVFTKPRFDLTFVLMNWHLGHWDDWAYEKLARAIHDARTKTSKYGFSFGKLRYFVPSKQDSKFNIPIYIYTALDLTQTVPIDTGSVNVFVYPQRYEKITGDSWVGVGGWGLNCPYIHVPVGMAGLCVLLGEEGAAFNGATIVHELGHLVGKWFHEDSPSNVMYSGTCYDNWTMTEKMKVAFLTNCNVRPGMSVEPTTYSSKKQLSDKAALGLADWWKKSFHFVEVLELGMKQVWKQITKLT